MQQELVARHDSFAGNERNASDELQSSEPCEGDHRQSAMPSPGVPALVAGGDVLTQLVFIVFPLVGGVLGALAYRVLVPEE
jgi:hypothetical protein